MTPDRNALAEYLRARRELLQPEEVGLPRDTNRRVRGLRREEVARLAGISAEYYLRLEQGRDHQPSEQVIRSLALALRLDENGHAYLLRLARPSLLDRSGRSRSTVSKAVLKLLGHWSHLPAYVSDRNHDVLAVTDPAASLAPGHLVVGANLLTALFEVADPVYSTDAWRSTARQLVAALRFHGDPRDRRLQQLVGDLSVNNREFRQLWALHEAGPQVSGTSLAHVQTFGWVTFTWQTLEVPGGDGPFLTTLFGEPGSTAEAACAYLADGSRRTSSSRLSA